MWPGLKQRDQMLRMTAFFNSWEIYLLIFRKDKAKFYLSKTTNNLNDPQKFWKTIKSPFTSTKPTGLPLSLVKNGVSISDKVETLNSFISYFTLSGCFYDSVAPMVLEPVNDVVTTSDKQF